MEYGTTLAIAYFVINWGFCINLFSTKKSEGEPKQLENQPHRAPKEEKVRSNLKPNPPFGSLLFY